MTPKEKARELHDKFDNILPREGTTRIQTPIDCALIAVDEILHCESTEPSDTDWDDCGSTAQYYWPQKKVDAGKFWGEVKEEIKKL